MNTRIRVPLALLGTGSAIATYATVIERNRFTLRQFTIPVLAPGSRPMTLLHLSDMHLTAGQNRKREWIKSLDDLDPDFVVNTGDTIAGHDAIEPALDALGPLLKRPGAFVFGSNDYWAPKFKNPLRYLWKDYRRVSAEPLPWHDLRAGMTGAGWLNLTNARGELRIKGRRISFCGVDDPHLKYDHYDAIAGQADPAADLRIGLAHSPEPRVLDRFVADGYDLILCGHTHGGQIRIPGYGALITNCGIDTAYSRWLHRWNDRSWLHISAGLGTSPFAPYRFACPPEASLLLLTPAE